MIVRQKERERERQNRNDITIAISYENLINPFVSTNHISHAINE